MGECRGHLLLRELALVLAAGTVWTCTGDRGLRGFAKDSSEPRKSFGLPALGGNKKYRQALTSKGDVQYLADVVVGEQVIKGIVDTGSFDLVVFPSYCKTCGSAATYDWESPDHAYGELSAKRPYGSGMAWTVLASDEVEIGPYHQGKQAFWEITSAELPQVENEGIGFGAILGVGPPSTPALDAWRHSMEAVKKIMGDYEMGLIPNLDMIKQAHAAVKVGVGLTSHPPMLKGLSAKNFSLCLQQKPGSDGYIIWDDASPLIAPKLFTKVNIAGKSTWTAHMSNANLANASLGCNEGCSALLDSGTSLLALPSSTIDALEAALAERHLRDDCSNLAELPDLAFELGGAQLRLPPDAYMMEVDGNVPDHLKDLVKPRVLGGSKYAVCRLMVMETVSKGQFGSLWILGLPFFRTYYTTFITDTAAQQPRALYLSEASSECLPQAASGSRKRAPAAQHRRVVPKELWVPESVLRASTAESLVL